MARDELCVKDYAGVIGAGLFLFEKFRIQAQESGVRRAAANLRKQGVPIETALIMFRSLPAESSETP